MNSLLLVLTVLMPFDIPTFQEAAQDTVPLPKHNEDLPLDPSRQLSFTTGEGTWMSVDVSPDGKTLIFDLLGDLYTMPIEGGKATQLTKGMAFDTHPVYSPDGDKVLFMSDRSGAENAWILDLETQETTQMTDEQNEGMINGDWSPDGELFVVARGRRNFKLHVMHKDGGRGVAIVDEPSNLKAIDPEFSADGKRIYYSRRSSAWNYNAQFPQYSIGMYNFETGRNSTLLTRYGSAFTPTLSPDGQWMVYGTRFESETGLVLRNLETGVEEWLAYPVQRDDQESQATLGVYPGMSFTPDSEHLVYYHDGGFKKININSKEIVTIPFEADVTIEVGPDMTFKYPIQDNPTVFATQIRDATPSPDGSQLAFTAMNKLYVMDLPNGTPRRVTNMDITEAMPSWSPDGTFIVYVTWDQMNGGHVVKVNPNERRIRPKQLTQKAAFYATPAFSSKGDRIIFATGNKVEFSNSTSRGAAIQSMDEYHWIPAEGGASTFIDDVNGRRFPHFVQGEDRIYLSDNDGKLISIRWDGTDQKEHVKITGISTYGTTDPVPPSEASVLYLSPNGKQVLAQVNNEIYTAYVPKLGEPVSMSVSNPDRASFPAKKVTILGGEFPRWSGDSQTVHWSLGKGHFMYNLSDSKAFEDSVKASEKAKKERSSEESKSEDQMDESSANEEVDSETNSDQKTEDQTPKEYTAVELKVEVPYEQDIPEGIVALTNARIITMRRDEVIERGDLVIINRRIQAVGPSGTVEIPSNATVLDMNGKTILPGFVDTHAHLRSTSMIHKEQEWSYAANLAYGVTTTRDPQTGTTDVLSYGDMVQAGIMIGPRIYSTGPGVGYWGYNLKSLEHTRDVLRQYSEYFDTKTIKMYRVGNRKQRQWIIQASHEQRLMPTTEGALDVRLNYTQLLDGYPGHEHNIPISKVYEDFIKTTAFVKMAVTPTMLVSYGGPWAEEYFYSRENPYDDEKLARFTPWDVLASSTRRRAFWAREDEMVFPIHAKKTKAFHDGGVIQGVGSHGQLQGLGYHWELWAMASGGLTEHEALRIATLIGAEAIGLDQDLGSLEPGKIADIVILDKNPLEDLRNTNSVSLVMMNGRLYEADTLNEVYPRSKAFDRYHFWESDLPVK